VTANSTKVLSRETRNRHPNSAKNKSEVRVPVRTKSKDKRNNWSRFSQSSWFEWQSIFSIYYHLATCNSPSPHQRCRWMISIINLFFFSHNATLRVSPQPPCLWKIPFIAHGGLKISRCHFVRGRNRMMVSKKSARRARWLYLTRSIGWDHSIYQLVNAARFRYWYVKPSLRMSGDEECTHVISPSHSFEPYRQLKIVDAKVHYVS
jgi:hypothetical protein